MTEGNHEGGGRMAGVRRARQETRREIAEFLSIGPVQVAELDLGDEGPMLRPGPGSPPVTSGAVFLLVRRAGRPVGTLLGEVPEGADPTRVLAALAREVPRGAAPGPSPAPPSASVVVATRERADQLARALDSLLAQDHPDFEIVVVDNAPETEETRELVERKYGERVGYVREPVPGLAIAHNRGLSAVRGAVVAFTDDDVVADPRWLTELTAPFAADPRLGCATGLILPARLGTPAQVLLESHGGFAKGFTPRTYDPERPPADEPLFPFTAGRFGSGASMAFRTEVLRAVGGFDPATGAGTRARGGDDLYGFVRVLAQGHRLRYTPSALVWHHHRETWRDLETQAYGYGAGLTAYLTAILVNRPALLPALLARVPGGLAHARALTAVRATEARAADVTAAGDPDAGGGAGPVTGAPGGHDSRTHPWPRRLARLQLRGMLYGPVGYLRARRALRTVGREAG
ncbi:putative mycofactocin biosynthesis glycosyltransferase MftF [Streptomyces ambofaciens ATCC 23877]|uniref:Putative mycofactocin biosynthesis glycosyltransferase MftF n=2 Tax=Streptomyces ambofaciens TaxID=1889 RepID=A0A0K2AWU5_STRA7|nr:putative mycofactocin biosynthesis glycosyltransferase MftF [Streptomyces ambofaciens ATCC 23877]